MAKLQICPPASGSLTIKAVPRRHNTEWCWGPHLVTRSTTCATTAWVDYRRSGVTDGGRHDYNQIAHNLCTRSQRIQMRYSLV